MTNFSTAKIRKDSLSLPQYQNRPQDATVHNSIPSSVLYSSHPQLDARISEESARHILKEASPKRSEPFPEEIAQAIHTFSQTRDVSDTREDVTETTIPAKSLITPAPLALTALSHMFPGYCGGGVACGTAFAKEWLEAKDLSKNRPTIRQVRHDHGCARLSCIPVYPI